MYSVEYTEQSRKFLLKLPKFESEIIVRKINSIKKNPFAQVKKLQGIKLWRLRIGKYRVILDIIISGNKIIVIRIGHRKNVYE
jgi:mRNA interferase RelE/StbE